MISREVRQLKKDEYRGRRHERFAVTMIRTPSPHCLPGLAAALFAVLCMTLSLLSAASSSAGTAGEKAGCRLEFRFAGNSALSDSRLRSLCPVSSGLSETELIEGVELAALEAYRNAGYMEASIESTSVVTAGAGKRAVIHIREGEPTRLDSFRFVGNRQIPSEELSSVCDLESGMILSGALLEDVLEKLVTYMTNQGFPFVVVRAGDFTMGSDGVSLTFFVDEGPLCTVDEVGLENSDALTCKALQGAIGIASGERYSEKELSSGIRALRRTALFSEVKEPIVSVSSENKVRIAVPVEERKTTSFAGAVGFRGRTSELTGELTLSLLNIARTGRSAKVGWEAMGRGASSFSLSYAEPWVMGLPFSSSLSLEHVVRDTLFARTSLSLLGKFPLASNVSAEAGTSFERALNTDGLGSRASRLAWLAGIEFAAGEPHWGAANSVLVALRGSRGTKKTFFFSSGEERRNVFSTMEGRTLLQRRLGRSQIAFVDVKASAILEGEESAAVDELFALGGKKTLRGYSERQFLAPTVSSIQLEYGVLVGREGGRAFALLDCGYAATQALSLRERFHVGYGVGLRIPSSFGVAGIDFAIPAGESLSSGKIHVGLEGAF
ncbi:MAG: hypothetical protein AMJ46_04875 [Latescibacteria bacterium DG_63]|nr:MAG: hypothetical protein AMJ46_04875 [Latescibacteria bacterium DG_63]